MNIHVSVIIPMREFDKHIIGILNHLNNTPEFIKEVIIVTDKKTYHKVQEVTRNIDIKHSIKSEYIKLENRSKALNKGVDISMCNWLWFLHVDSQLHAIDLKKLEQQLAKNADSCWYFNLKYFKPRPFFMLLTELMVRLRCIVFALPFGDQGIMVKREHFDKVNGFDDVTIAEDLHFVLKLKRAKIALRSTHQPIFTSAEKYRKNKWLKTTLNHIRIVIRVVIGFYLVKTVKK